MSGRVFSLLLPATYGSPVPGAYNGRGTARHGRAAYLRLASVSRRWSLMTMVYPVTGLDPRFALSSVEALADNTTLHFSSALLP